MTTVMLLVGGFLSGLEKKYMPDEWHVDPNDTITDPSIEIVPNLAALDRLLETATQPVAQDAPNVSMPQFMCPRGALQWMQRAAISFLSGDPAAMRAALEEPLTAHEDELVEAVDEDALDAVIRELHDPTMRNLCMRVVVLDRRVARTQEEVRNRLVRAWHAVVSDHGGALRKFDDARESAHARLNAVADQMHSAVRERRMDPTLDEDARRIQQHHRAICERRGIAPVDDVVGQVQALLRDSDGAAEPMLRQHAANVESLEKRKETETQARRALNGLIDDVLAAHLARLEESRPTVTTHDIQRLRDAQAEEESDAERRLRGVDDERSGLARDIIELQYDRTPEERARANRALTECDAAQGRRRGSHLRHLRATVDAIRAILRMRLGTEAHAGDAPGAHHRKGDAAETGGTLVPSNDS